MSYTQSQLYAIMRERGVERPLHGSGRYGAVTNDDLERALCAASLRDMTQRGEAIPWGLKQRLMLDHVMLSFQYKHLTEEQQRYVLDSDLWVSEEKENGMRGVLTFHVDEGFGFYGRNRSKATFIPMDYSAKLLFRTEKGELVSGTCTDIVSSLRNAGVKSFMCDGEVLPEDGGYVETGEGVFTESQLDAVVATLGSEIYTSHHIQRTTCPLRVVLWDVMQFNGANLVAEQWKYSDRRMTLRNLSGALYSSVKNLQQNEMHEDKRRHFNNVVKRGGEGVVLKNLTAPYTNSVNRNRHYSVKLKRSMQLVGESDIDSFVTGYTLGEQYTKQGLVAGLKLSVILRNEAGEREHWIATVSGMPMEIRNEISMIGEDGLPCIKPDVYGRVLVIDGQDISARNTRLAHAVADWKRGWRTDKDASQCTMEEEFVQSQIF